VWLAPAHLYDAAEVLHRAALARAAAHRLRDTDEPVMAPRPACGGFRELLAAGALAGVAVRARVAGDALTARAVWGVRRGDAIAAALAAVPRPLPLRADGAVLTASVRLRDTAGLRSLPRPSIMNGTRRHYEIAERRCGRATGALVALFAWPELAGMVLDEAAAIDPVAERLVESIGNAGIAIRAAAPSLRRVAGVAEVEVVTAAAPAVERILDLTFGHRRRPDRSRPVVAWGRGPVRPFSRPASAGRVVFGATQGTGIPAAGKAAAPAHRGLVSLRGDAGALARQLAGAPWWPRWLDRAAPVLGAVTATATASADRVEASLSVSLAPPARDQKK
jgi:hypothetical protein